MGGMESNLLMSRGGGVGNKLSEDFIDDSSINYESNKAPEIYENGIEYFR
jgi:hypothetical protein